MVLFSNNVALQPARYPWKNVAHLPITSNCSYFSTKDDNLLIYLPVDWKSCFVWCFSPSQSMGTYVTGWHSSIMWIQPSNRGNLMFPRIFTPQNRFCSAFFFFCPWDPSSSCCKNTRVCTEIRHHPSWFRGAAGRKMQSNVGIVPHFRYRTDATRPKATWSWSNIFLTFCRKPHFRDSVGESGV